MRKWKVALLSVLLLGLSGLVMYSAFGWSEGGDQPLQCRNIIRFHVVANSDCPDDQKLKLLVRDEVLKVVAPELNQARSAEEAWCKLADNRELMRVSAEKVIRAHGYNYPVQVDMGRWQFPTRCYGKLVLAAGSYEAVRVTIGNGEGQNWWCVIFPPLCLVDIAGGVSEQSSAARAANESINATTQPTYAAGGKGSPAFTIRFKLWDWLQASAQHLEQVLGWQSSPDEEGYQE